MRPRYVVSLMHDRRPDETIRWCRPDSAVDGVAHVLSASLQGREVRNSYAVQALTEGQGTSVHLNRPSYLGQRNQTNA
jgi:hypothetical protein